MPRGHRVQVPVDTQVQCILEGLSGTPVEELCRRYALSQSQYYRLRDRFLEGGKAGLVSNGRDAERVALEAALRERFPEGVRGRGLKVASDNGSAFLSEHFQTFARNLEVELLRTRVRYPEGNGRCERLIRTIKEEEIWLNEYATLDEARARLGEFFEFYNAERIHSALGYASPRQYVALWRAGRLPKRAA
mgnify:CR=1 FL=1